MAGRGSRLRPHTLTVPKPLIPIAGKPIVHRLVEDIAGLLNQQIEEIAFIIHKDFGKQVEKDLVEINTLIANLDFTQGDSHLEVIGKHDALNMQLSQLMEKWESKMSELED